MGELNDSAGLVTGQIADSGQNVRRLASRVMSIVFDKAIHLPLWHPMVPQRGGESLGRDIDETNLTADRFADRLGDLCMGDSRGPRDGVCLTQMARLGEDGRSDRRYIPHIDGTDASVSNRGEESTFVRDRFRESE